MTYNVFSGTLNPAQSVNPVSRSQHISDLHSKFALGTHRV